MRLMRPMVTVVLVLAAVAAWAREGEVVSRVRVEAPGLDDAESVVGLLGVREGQPLDRVRLRGGLLALYARGDVDYVKVTAVHSASGLELVVRLDLRPRLAKITVAMPGRVWRRRVRGWLDLEPGGVITTSQVEAAVERTRRKLVSRGYPDAHVQPYLDYDRAANRVALSVVVDLGEAERLLRLELEGLDDGLQRAVADEVGDVAGEQLDDRFLDRLGRRVEGVLNASGFWEAQVLEIGREVGDGGVVVVLRVATGPRYELVVSTSREHEDLLRGVIPDLAEGELHPTQTALLVERVRESLQEKGYLLATVAAQVEARGELRVLSVVAEVGRQRRVTAVDFPGVAGIDPDELRAVVKSHTQRGTLWRRQRFTDSSLASGRTAVIDEYLRRGFADVEVGAPVIEALGVDAARVVFEVREGRRWVLSDLRHLGFPADAAPALESGQTSLAEAGPWDARQLEVERQRLEVLLADLGFPEGRVRAATDSSEPGTVRVVLTAEPGAFVRIGEIVVDGLARTRVSVVRRMLHLAGVTTGAPYSRVALLQAQRDLYELALFRRVEIAPIPGQETSTRRGLVVRCEEGEHRSYLFGLGWDTTALTRVTLGWSHLNLLGGAHAVSVETRLSDREQRFQASVREPRVPWVGVPGYAVAYRTEEQRATYSQERRGLWFDLGDRRRQPFRPWLRYEYQIVAPDAPEDILSDLEREEQEIELASLTPTLEWDTRDSPLTPSQGVLATASLEYAFPAFQAEAHFLKLLTSFTLYGSLGDGGFAVGTRVGLMQPIGADPEVSENLQIPLNARFFAGGTVSHRAFRTDYLGIEGQTLRDGEPIGGNALVLVNGDIYMPITGGLSAVLFADVGNVWAEPGLINAQDLRWGSGLGVRYDTPAGPLRMEYGWKLDRLADESPGEFFLSFGVAF
jgi:outer membrane protein insertion porin family